MNESRTTAPALLSALLAFGLVSGSGASAEVLIGDFRAKMDKWV